MYNYIITGGRGFVGSEVCRQLLKKNTTNKIIIFDNDYKKYGDSNLIDILQDKRLTVFSDDLRLFSGEGFERLQSYTAESNYVINLAAVIGGIGLFNKIPATILRDNNLINTNVMDAIISLPKNKRPHYLCVSSSMVFESAKTFPSKESDVNTIQVPITAYGFSKLSAEWYCKAYAAEHDFKYTIIRPFNAVGPEKPDPNFVGFSHVIPDLICKIHNGQGTEENPLKILGNGQQVRHYTDVRDIADGIITCLHSPKSVNEDFNISIGKGHTVEEVANLVWFAIHPKSSKRVRIQHIPGFAHDVQNRVPDISKMEHFFGWRAKNTLETVMPEIVNSVIGLLK